MSIRRSFIELIETGTPHQLQAAIDQGEDVNAQDKLLGWTALMYAARFNQNLRVITTLLKAGPDGKAKSNEGKTAFDYAQDNESLEAPTPTGGSEAQY